MNNPDHELMSNVPCIMSNNFSYVRNPGGVADVAENLSACLQEIVPNFSETSPRNSRATAATLRRFASEVLLEAQYWRRDAILFFPNYFALPLPGSRTRDVVLVHDLQFKSYPEFHSPLRRAILEFAHRVARRRAAGVVFISRTTEADFLKHYGAPHLYKTILNPVDVQGAKSTSSRREIESPYAIANFHSYPHKNVRKVFELFNQVSRSFPELKLVVTGNHREAETILQGAGTPEESVVFTGFIEKERVLNLSRHAEFFMSASLFEGFNMSAAEAAKLRRPVLLSDIPVHRELFSDYAHLFDLGSPALDLPRFRAYLDSFPSRPAWTFAEDTEPSAVAKQYRDFFLEIARAR
ncbi:glycosyltransferase involved in cell wall biosynthesis [Bradyrhizobium sp. JR1.5]|uniref:glycosyltransferase n=1 Tax=unclassified Bradyrhizobium TaxID=2631580 RepID=UPI0033956D04